MRFRLQTVRTAHCPRETPRARHAMHRRAVAATRRAGRPQPLFPSSSSAKTHPISFSTSDTILFCLETARTGSLPRETPSGSPGCVTRAPSRHCGVIAHSAVAVFARREPRRQPFVRGNPSWPAGVCGAHVRGIRDRRPRDPRPAGRAGGWITARGIAVCRPFMLVSFLF